MLNFVPTNNTPMLANWPYKDTPIYFMAFNLSGGVISSDSLVPLAVPIKSEAIHY